MVDGSTSTVLLDGLTPLTEYQVSVYSVIGETRSEPLKGIDVTCEQTTVSILFSCAVSVSYRSEMWMESQGTRVLIIHVSITRTFPKNEKLLEGFGLFPPQWQVSEISPRDVIFLCSEALGVWGILLPWAWTVDLSYNYIFMASFSPARPWFIDFFPCCKILFSSILYFKRTDWVNHI